MRHDFSTCSSQNAMHHGVPGRVFFRRSSKHHSRNDSSSSTSWSHDSHVFSHSRTSVVPGTFLWVLHNIHSHLAFARELEEKEKNTDQQYVCFFVQLWNSLFTRKQNAREWNKADVGISHQTENEEEYFVYVPVFFHHFPKYNFSTPTYVAVLLVVNQRSKLRTYNCSAEVAVFHTPVEVRFSFTCRSVDGQGKRGNGTASYVIRNQPYGVIHAETERPSEKRQTSVYVMNESSWHDRSRMICT